MNNKQIQEAYILMISEELNKEAMVGRIKDMHDSGKFDITSTNTDRGVEYSAQAKKPANAVEYLGRKGRTEMHWHDPEISHTKTGEGEYAWTHAHLNKDSSYHDHVQDDKKSGVIYRGMSHEEFHNIKKTGFIKSRGDKNMEGQDSLTYYSKDPSQAQSYAHSFAHQHNKATGQHNAYVVAVKDPGTDIKIKGTGEDEVGIPHSIPASDILHVHVGRAYASIPGSFGVNKEWGSGKHTEGSSSGVTTHVGWKKTDYDKA